MKVFDPKKHDFRTKGKDEPAKSGETEREEKREGECLDEALKETFPASDPPAITTPKETDCTEMDTKTKKREGK